MPNTWLYATAPIVEGSIKGIKMNAFDWAHAWGQHGDKGDLTPLGAYGAVAWIRRCVEIRANALSAIPVKYYKGQGSTERQWEYADLMPHILWMTEAAAQVYGAAYWLRLVNPYGFEKGYRWLLPSRMTPKYDTKKGLSHFERQTKDGKEDLTPKQVVYFWQPNLAAEIGPGDGWVKTVLTESGVAKFMNEFASAFFERGAMPGTLLSVEGNPRREDLDKLEQWWKRFLGGMKRAWETVAVAATVKPIVVGYPTKDLAMPELLSATRQQICVAAGVPQTMLEDAANFATAREQHQAFYSETVVPEATLIESALNQQIFRPAGMRVVLDWESLDIFQEDEAERAVALGQMTTAGVPLDLAMEMLGMELPGEMDYDALRRRLLEDKAQGQARALQIASAQQREEEAAGEQREELRRWQRKSLKALRDGKSAQVEFETDILGADTQDAIRDRLAAAATEEEVKAAFAAPFALKEAPTRDPDDPLGAEKDAAEARLIRLLKSRLNGQFDAIMGVLGDPPNINNLTPEFWETEAGRLLATLSPELEAMAMAAAASATATVVWDEAVLAREAIEWARQYAYDLVSQLNRHTMELLQRAVASFLETPGMTIGDLRRELAPAFGERRAQTIAVTETTRAFDKGTQLVQQELGRAGIRRVRQWRTAMDDKVCPICAPLEGKSEDDWGGLPGPPAHPNCRCWTVLVEAK